MRNGRSYGGGPTRAAGRRGGQRPRRGSLRPAAERLERRLAPCARHATEPFEPPPVDDLAGQPAPAESSTIDSASLGEPLGGLRDASAAVALAANGLPRLTSLPGAPTAIYLDFGGAGGYASYDEDGDPSTFSVAEQATITEAWRQVSVAFAVFDVDVTTVQPTVPFAWHVTSPGISGGWSSVGVFPNSSPQSFNNAGDARTRISGIVHELGHNFGLNHQSDYDLLGVKTREYSLGTDPLRGPLMGVDYAKRVPRWSIGHPSTSASRLQDDIAVIAAAIKARQPAGGDGFRADDFGGTVATARALAATAGGRSISGIIERLSDVDVFSFDAAGGGAVVSVVPTSPSGLDAKLEVFDASGTLVAASDRGTSEQQIVLPPATGTWYVAVSSHGDYGDVGAYDLSVNDLPAGWSSADVGATGSPGDAGYDAATGTFTLAGSGAGVAGPADVFRFAWRRLTGDGSIVARVAVNPGSGPAAMAGIEIRESLSADSPHAAVVISRIGGPRLVCRGAAAGPSSVVAGATAASGPVWVRLVRSGDLVTASRSDDGVSWTTVGSATVAMGATAFVGLLSAGGSTMPAAATFTDVSLEGSLDVPEPLAAVPPPAGVSSAPGGGTSLVVSWGAVAGATGYVIERSIDGVDFATAASVAVPATDFTDADLSGGLRYFHRVRAIGPAGRSGPSAAASAVNRPNGVADLAVTSLSVSQVVLNWRDTSGETGYRIERSADGAAFTQIATVAANVPSHAVAGLAVGTRYWFRVTPLSPFGDAEPAVAAGSTRLQAVAAMSFTTKTSSAIGLQWTAVTGATGYRIERSTDGGSFSTLAQVAAPEVTYSDAAVEPLGEYYYRVVATAASTEGLGFPLPIFTAVPAAAPLPSPWIAVDVGNAPGAGASGHAAGTFTVVAAGADIWGTADAFRYTYRTLVGDGWITARVATLESTSGWAKAGVMIRESTAANSRHVQMILSPDNGAALQYRQATGGSATHVAGPASARPPSWVRLVRAGDVLTGFSSPDGVAWTRVGSVTMPLGTGVLVGLSATANSSVRLNTSTFTDVAVGDAAPTVAVPAAAVPAVVTGRTATLSVTGADDGGEAALRYAWAASGPGPVTFSANGSNAARSTVATFSAAGSYLLTATIADARGATATSSVVVTVAQSIGSIVVTPGSTTLPAGSSRQFSATALDQFGDPLAAQPTLAWQASGGGSISATGLFTAPPSAAVSTVAASASSISGAATVVTTVDEVVRVEDGETVTDVGGRSGAGPLVKRGGGRLVLAGGGWHAGGTIVEEGELVIRSLAALGSGRLEVRAAARVTLDVGTGTLSLPALLLDPLGRIELGIGRLSIRAGGIGESALVPLLVAGRADGSWAGEAGFTSLAARSGRGFGVGCAVSPDAITIAFAALGDTNLDGTVDAADVANLLAHAGEPDVASPGWSRWDFNYDGVVDDLDIAEFAAAGLFDRGSYLEALEAGFASLAEW